MPLDSTSSIYPEQIRTVDPYSPFYSDIVSRISQVVTKGEDVILSIDPVDVSIDSTSSLLISTGRIIKDDILITFTEEHSVDLTNDYFFPDGNADLSTDGYYYVCVDYTYGRSQPAPRLSIQILKPSQRNWITTLSQYFLLKVFRVINGDVHSLFNIDPSPGFQANVRKYSEVYFEISETLPTYTSEDKGRLIYVNNEAIPYFGGDNGWEEIGGVSIRADTSLCTLGQLGYFGGDNLVRPALMTTGNVIASIADGVVSRVGSGINGIIRLIGRANNVPVESGITISIGDTLYLSSLEAGTITNSGTQMVGTSIEDGTVVDIVFIPGSPMDEQVSFNQSNIDQLARDLYGTDFLSGMLTDDGTSLGKNERSALSHGGHTRTSATLQDMINDSTVNEAIIINSGTWNITADLTFPEEITLIFNSGALFEIGAGVSIIIGGEILAGNWQIFSGSGTVSLGGGLTRETRPEWWGQKDSASINLAITAVSDGTNQTSLVFSPGTWDIDVNVTIPSEVTMKFIPGAMFDGAGTLTVNGQIECDPFPIFSTDLTLVLDNCSNECIEFLWWDINNSSEDSAITTINSSITSSDIFRRLRFLPGDYEFTNSTISANLSAELEDGATFDGTVAFLGEIIVRNNYSKMFNGDGIDVSGSTNSKIYPTWWEDTTLNGTAINRAISSIGSSDKTLMFSGGIFETSNQTILVPSNITLEFDNDSSLNIVATSDFTIEGYIKPCLHQIFNGTSANKMNSPRRLDIRRMINREVYPQWFDGEDDYEGINQAIFNVDTFPSDSTEMSSQVVVLTGKTWIDDTGFTLPATKKMRLEHGAILMVGDSVTTTLNGELDLPFNGSSPVQVFDFEDHTTGNLDLENNNYIRESYIEWFGNIDGVNDHLYLSDFISSIGSGGDKSIKLLPNKTYTVSGLEQTISITLIISETSTIVFNNSAIELNFVVVKNGGLLSISGGTLSFDGSVDLESNSRITCLGAAAVSFNGDSLNLKGSSFISLAGTSTFAIHADSTLYFADDSYITNGSSNDLTILNGNFKAEKDSYIFRDGGGGGNFLFGAGLLEAYPEWWGAKIIADAKVPFDNAINSLDTGGSLYLNGTYSSTSSGGYFLDIDKEINVHFDNVLLNDGRTQTSTIHINNDNVKLFGDGKINSTGTTNYAIYIRKSNISTFFNLLEISGSYSSIIIYLHISSGDSFSDIHMYNIKSTVTNSNTTIMMHTEDQTSWMYNCSFNNIISNTRQTQTHFVLSADESTVTPTFQNITFNNCQFDGNGGFIDLYNIDVDGTYDNIKLLGCSSELNNSRVNSIINDSDHFIVDCRDKNITTALFSFLGTNTNRRLECGDGSDIGVTDSSTERYSVGTGTPQKYYRTNENYQDDNMIEIYDASWLQDSTTILNQYGDLSNSELLDSTSTLAFAVNSNGRQQFRNIDVYYGAHEIVDGTNTLPLVGEKKGTISFLLPQDDETEFAVFAVNMGNEDSSTWIMNQIGQREIPVFLQDDVQDIDPKFIGEDILVDILGTKKYYRAVSIDPNDATRWYLLTERLND